MIPGRALVKLRQRERWGTPEWIASYARRSHVEGIFGNPRHLSTQTIGRGFCRVFGLVNTTLMLTFEVMAANLRLVREWARRTGENSDPWHAPYPESYDVEGLGSDGQVSPVTGDPDEDPPDSWVNLSPFNCPA